MIVVKLELWPFGDESKAEPIGRTYIWNDGTSKSQSIGNYKASVCEPDSTEFHESQREGTVTNYPRLNTNVWRLVLRALKSAFPEENSSKKG